MKPPQFPIHDYHMYKSLKGISVAVILALSSAAAYYCLVTLPYRATYRKFYSTYDPMSSFKRMKDGGYLSACPPEPKQ